MRVKAVEIGPSPLRGGFTRITAAIEVESRAKVLSYWFDAPADLDPAQAQSGNPWAVLLLPLACYFGERLVVDRPLDRVLHENLLGVQGVWSAWYPEIKPVAIEARAVVDADRREAALDPSKKTISSFSGGVDSLFTFLRHKDRVRGDASAPIDDLLYVGGFNTVMEDFDQARRELEPFAARAGRRLVPVVTNIRYGSHALETPYSIEHWMERLAHGAFLAGIAHMLGRRYREFIIPASPSYRRLVPWGSHPLCDPLLGSSDLRVTHDGASFNRIARIEAVAAHDGALDILYVCRGPDRRRGNCCRCWKCLCTMTTLDLLGARARAKTFDWSNYSINRLSRIWLAHRNERLHCADIAERADRDGRPELARALRKSISFSRRRAAILALINSNRVSRTAWRGVFAGCRAIGSLPRYRHPRMTEPRLSRQPTFEA